MFKSQFFTAIIFLTFLAVAAALAFQVLEMRDYEMLKQFGINF